MLTGRREEEGADDKSGAEGRGVAPRVIRHGRLMPQGDGDVKRRGEWVIRWQVDEMEMPTLFDFLEV